VIVIVLLSVTSLRSTWSGFSEQGPARSTPPDFGPDSPPPPAESAPTRPPPHPHPPYFRHKNFSDGPSLALSRMPNITVFRRPRYKIANARSLTQDPDLETAASREKSGYVRFWPGGPILAGLPWFVVVCHPKKSWFAWFVPVWADLYRPKPDQTSIKPKSGQVWHIRQIRTYPDK
jgi:hypothetical protein